MHSHHQKLGTGKKGTLPRVLEGGQSCRALGFLLLASKTVTESISVAVSHLVCVTLLRHPWETNTLANLDCMMDTVIFECLGTGFKEYWTRFQHAIKLF